jgi:RNA polymerase sigma-70 factor, ECF subfamily
VSEPIPDLLQSLIPRLWRFCLGLTRHRPSAEDLLQTTCVRILERPEQFQPDTRFDRWAFRIAHTVWLNELRSRRVREGQGFDQEPIEDLVDPRMQPDWMVFHSQVFKAVMDLPEAQRVTMMLVYVEGFSYAEAATALDIPQGTVMSRLALARRKLAVQLSETHGAGVAATPVTTPSLNQARYHEL